MPFSCDQEEMAAQAEALRLFSCLLGLPDRPLLDVMGSLAPFYEDDADALALIDGMAESLERDGAAVLQVDYARLFEGPFEMLAPPYATLYLEPGGCVMGETACAVAQIYREHGLRLSDERNRPADHLCYLLEFLYYLVFRLLGMEEGADRDAAGAFADDFARRYVLSWAPRFFADVLDGARTDYYRCLARLGLDHFPLSLGGSWDAGAVRATVASE